MKKIISALLISANLLTITANAAWEFEEKMIDIIANTLLEFDSEIIAYRAENTYDPGDEVYPKIVYSFGCKYENGEVITYTKTTEDVKDIMKSYRKNNQFENSVSDKKFEVRTVNSSWCIDAEGNNIFGETHYGVIPLDYGKFLVVNDGGLKLLTRKDKALHTDIKTLINGVEIPCYSAEGRCVVVAEDLRNYGFDVIWNGEERCLDIIRNPEYYTISPLPIQKKKSPGSYYDKIATSDISVYFDGREINGYCINGVTLIQPESLKSEGISFNYDNSQRTLFMTVEGMEYK